VRNPPIEIDVLPAQAQQLAAAHAGLDRELDQRAQVGHTALIRGSQQELLFIALETPSAPLRR